jgi:copper chaperone CopZ
MKFKYVLISVFAFAFACQNAPKENTTEEKEVTEEIAMVNVQKIELNIDGMTCTGCENAIQKTIDGFEGVYSSKADFEKGKAILEFDSTKVDIIKVKDAINNLGYEAKEHSILTE